MFRLYTYHLSKSGLPRELIELTYFQFDEARRLRALSAVFERYEYDLAVKERVENIVDYFDWCADSRNMLLLRQELADCI